MQTNFVHLKVHSEYSLSDGIVRVKPLIQQSVAGGMSAVALTDQHNLFAAVKFYRAATAAGVKPIFGCDVLIRMDDNALPSRLTLLCRNQEGYRQLTELISRAYVEGQENGVPLIEKAWISNAASGLIALSGGREGDVGVALLRGDFVAAKTHLQFWQTTFPDRFYLELQRCGRSQEETYNHRVLVLATEHNVPVVATNDVRFLQSDDFEAHEARVCIHDGYVLNDPKRPRQYTEQQYLRSADEMKALFSDIPEALDNTVEIAKRCNVQLTLGENYLPDFPIPDAFTTETFLESESQQGLSERLAQLKVERQPYDERLKIELDVINGMGFAGYFLIVADFIRWAKNNGVPVGPGRGSGAGSLVAYALGITDLDPLEYNLLFERFLNPERVSMPDFDIDFCMEGRDRVIDYVTTRYGRESVSQIITYGTMAAKAVIRDVGRVLGHPYGFVDKIAKLIPFEIGITLDKALEDEEELQRRYQEEDDVHDLIDLARKLEGITRNAGKHAGGVVISPGKLTDFSPLYCEENGDNLVTQFDKDDVEAVGLVKFDFLGLRTLTIIDWAVKSLQEPIDIASIPMDDTASFDLLKACKTTAVFQLESRGMKDLIKRLQPDCFEDIVALVALFRPGPLQSGMVDDFINRKHGHAKVEYPHLDLEWILKPTYGVILYQEQVMQIAQVLAGYSLGAADLLRRAMGKKKPEEMAKQRAIFTEGATKRGVDEEQATRIFDLMEKFAGYGFNKSHSAAYALVAYQTAWLKAHYPAAFMAAVLSSDMDNTEKVVIFIEDCRALELTVLPPQLNESDYKFKARTEAVIAYGLGAIKGVGESAIEAMLAAREQGGPFTDLFDFCQRVDLRKANRRVIEALIKSGAMDVFGVTRAVLHASIDSALRAAEQYSANAECGQNDLFSGAGDAAATAVVDYTMVVDWTLPTRLQGEKETLGFYLSGHPIDAYQDELAHFTQAPLHALRASADRTITAGMVVSIRKLITKRGKRMAIATLADQHARMDVTLFSEACEQYRDYLEVDRLWVVEGEVGMDDYTGGLRITAERLWDLPAARAHFAHHLLLTLDAQILDNQLLPILYELLQKNATGACRVQFQYQQPTAQVQLTLGHEWRIHPTDALLTELRGLLGDTRVEFVYQ